jgi:hypothetical protein
LTDATCHKARIERLRKERRGHLRKALRARARRTIALAKLARPHTKAQGRRWRADAQSALRVRRRHRESAQEDLADIRALRADCHKHSLFVRWLRHNRSVIGTGGTTKYFDGHRVATWIVDLYLAPARRAGVQFYVTSGERSLATAQYLWNNAGRLGLVHYVNVAYPCTSNHCGVVFPKGAVDAWDRDGGSDRLRAYIRAHQVAGRELRAYHDVVGTRDEPHYSHTGH